MSGDSKHEGGKARQVDIWRRAVFRLNEEGLSHSFIH